MQQSQPKAKPDSDLQNSDLRFQAVHAQELSKFLRQWSGRILNDLEGDSRAECQLMLEGMVTRLDRMSRRAVEKHGPVQRSRETLLHALCAAMCLRDRSKLAETFRHTLGCVPGLLDGLGDQPLPSLPSASQISESQIQIDAALCSYFKRKFEAWSEGNCCVYMWADSSPQGGTDWLMSMMRIIEGSKLAGCVQAATFLEESLSDLAKLTTGSEAVDELAERSANRIEEIIQERHAAGCFLKENIILHRQIPMALGTGTGAANLDQKLLCMCKKFIAETHRPSLTRAIMHCIRAFCTDLGTESAFAEQVEGFNFGDVLPQWMQDEGLQPDDGDFPGANDDNYIFANALPSPGLLHIAHNMCADVHKALSGYPRWLPQFKAVAQLLHHKHLRKRFIATCLLNTPWAWMASQLETAAPLPALWRWQTVQKTLPFILGKKRMLQLTWDPQKFGVEVQRVGPEADDGPAEGEFQPSAITTAVRSEAWWLYTSMLAKLNEFPADLAAWAEGCSCHPWLIQGEQRHNSGRPGDQPNEAQRLCEIIDAVRKTLGYGANGDGKGYRPCPMAGQRSAELASGEVWKQLDSWNEKYVQAILEENACSDEAEVEAALKDFANGKSLIVEYLGQKLQCWESLPWKLAALNQDSVIVRRIAQNCLGGFDKQREAGAGADLHHRLTLKFCEPGSTGRKELVDFINGASLDVLPELSSFVYGMKFIPVVERIQEREHALTKKLVAHRGKISGPFVSCRLRIEELRKVLDCPDELVCYLQSWEDIANPDNMAKRFGFWNHPLWVAAVENKYAMRLKMSLAASILYAMDPETQFAKVTASRAKRERKKKEKEKRVRTALQRYEGRSQKRWVLDNIERMAAAHHLQDKLSMGCLYSLSHDSLQFVGLRESLRRPPPPDEKSGARAPACLTQGEAINLELDVEPPVSFGLAEVPQAASLSENSGQIVARGEPEQASSRDAMTNIVFLKVVNSQPSRRKNVSIPAAESKRLSPTDLCVTFHRATMLHMRDGNSQSEEAGPQLCVSVDAEAACGISHQVNVLSVCGNNSSSMSMASTFHL